MERTFDPAGRPADEQGGWSGAPAGPTSPRPRPPAVDRARQAGTEAAVEAVLLEFFANLLLDFLPLHAEGRIGEHVVEEFPEQAVGGEVGRGCGGRGIIHGFELLEKLGFHEWGFDYVLLDFLGDVVCGGFGLPIARDMCQKVIVVGSNDLQSLYVANNVCSAVEYFRKLGGNVGVAGMVINKDDHTGEAQAFAQSVGIPVLAAIPADEDIRRKSANYEIIGKLGGEWAPLFQELAGNVVSAPPRQPKPLDQDGLLGLFKSDTVGRDVVLEPASQEDMRGGIVASEQSLEVIYDTV